MQCRPVSEVCRLLQAPDDFFSVVGARQTCLGQAGVDLKADVLHELVDGVAVVFKKLHRVRLVQDCLLAYLSCLCLLNNALLVCFYLGSKRICLHSSIKLRLMHLAGYGPLVQHFLLGLNFLNFNLLPGCDFGSKNRYRGARPAVTGGPGSPRFVGN